MTSFALDKSFTRQNNGSDIDLSSDFIPLWNREANSRVALTRLSTVLKTLPKLLLTES